jgi:hypothetical protein
MDWSALHAITEIAVAGAAFLASWSALSMRAAMSELRKELAEARSKDREELREWINGSFLRASVVTSELKAVDHRLNFLERKAA